MSRFFDRRLLQQAQSERASLILAVTLGAVGGVATVLQAFALSRAVGGVFLGGLDLAGVSRWLIALIALAVVRASLTWAGEVTASGVALRVKRDLRARLMAHVMALGPAYVRGERTGELANTAVEGLEALDAYFGHYLPQLALAAIVPVIFLASVFPLDPLSGLVLLLTAPLIPLFMILIGSMADARTRRQWRALSRMSAHFLDMLQGLPTLKLFGRSREQIRVIAEIGDRYRHTTLDVLRVAFLSAFALEMIGTISTAIVAVEIGLRLLYGRLAFEQAFFVLILAPEFYLPLRLLGTRFHAAIAGVTAAQRVYEVLDTPVMEGQRAGGSPPLDARPPASVRVAFHDVHYAYDDGARPVLNGVSFEIGPREKVALVGASGAGKTTIAHLLLGFIAPAAGNITVTADGNGPVALAPGNPSCPTWVAWVPQLPYLFNDTVADNIRLGRPEVGMDRVIQAAQLAHADAFIRALPQGYQTVVGERGARLSGGQAQRIALARAFLLDAPLVILDEATANLDADTEALIGSALEALLADRSALIIAHRLNTVRRADRILVLEGGRIVEWGTHEELMARRGPYWRLVQAASLDDRRRTTVDRRPKVEGPRSTISRRPLATEYVSGDDRTDRHLLTHRGQEIASSCPAGDLIPTIDLSQRADLVGEVPEAMAGRGPLFGALYRSRRVLFRLLSFLAPFWRWILLSVLLGFGTVGSSIGLMATSAWIIATAALQPSIAELQVAIVGVRFFGIARGVLRYLERLASHQVTFRVLTRIRTWFYAAVEPLAPARLARYRSGDLLSRIVADVGILENFYIRAIAPPLVALLVAGLMGVFLGSFDGRLAAAVLGMMGLTGLGLPAVVQALSRTPGQRLVAVRAQLNAALVDSIQGTGDLAAFGAREAYMARLRRLDDALRAAQGRTAALSGFSAAAGGLLTHLAVVAVLALAIPLVTAGRMDGVQLAVLALATAASFEAVLPLPQAAQQLTSCRAAAARLFELADDRQPSVQSIRPQPSHGPEVPPAHKTDGPPGISFREVTLRYAADEPPALDRVTLDVPAGQTVAIVGPSGAGKTSLANALLRFWDYQEGAVTFGGRELRELDAAALRGQIGVVAQDTHLFNATVRENLLLARPEATREQIEAAAHAAGIGALVASLPQGYETWIGEDGLRLSAGERQRLAIARAFLRDAPVLILDEPTSHLDARTERQLMETLARLLVGRTALVITHRLQLARNAHRIAVMDRGRVADIGTHEELIARCELYRHALTGIFVSATTDSRNITP